MSGKHLLVVTLGPVQEFIKAGRRTRDLWAGSRLLSAISRAAATEISKHGELIFPGRIQGDLPSEIANVVVAELREGAPPKKVAADAKGAAEKVWGERGECGFQEPGRSHRPRPPGDP